MSEVPLYAVLALDLPENHLVRLRLQKVLSHGENNYFTQVCSGAEAGSYVRLIDLCITQL